MHSIIANLSLLDSMLNEMETYLLSEEIFWPMSIRKTAHASRLRLTLGNLLLTLDELDAQKAEMSDKQKIEYSDLKKRFEQIRDKWAAAMERKATFEIGARLNLWKSYIQDVEQDSEMMENYAHEVRNRLLLSRLIDLVGGDSGLEKSKGRIRQLDKILSQYVSPGEFVWDDRLRSIYPPERFPFLYLQPRPRK